MADAENFEDDLFADLYEDTETAKPAPQQPVSNAPRVPEPAAPEPVESAAQTNEQENEDYDNMNDDDDDDDVDFNLGGGTSNHMSNAGQHDDAPSTPPYGTVHKASAKEDG